MLSIELDDLIKQIIKTKAESQTVEVKAAHGGTPKRLYDTLSSFSNQDGGGIIVFGLDEAQDFKPVGVYELQDLQKKVTEQCNQMFLRFALFSPLPNMKELISAVQKFLLSI